MSIHRKAKRAKWTTLDNELINDSSLDFAALGALVYILSKPDDWIIRMSDMQRRGDCGRTAMRALMKRLEAAGYAKLAEVHSATGLAGSSWEVSEDKTLSGTVTVRKPDGQAERLSDDVTVSEPAPLVKTDSVLMTDAVPKTKKDIAPNVTARGAAQRATSKSKAQRQPKPLYDAFKAAFPNAHSSLAGRFDSTCIKRGFTVDMWHAFMATADARKDYLRGTLTMGNALNRFVAWGDDQAPAIPATDKPAGAPDNWRSLVYSYDGTRLWPALALPRMGLDPHAPPSSWPAWYRAFEGSAA